MTKKFKNTKTQIKSQKSIRTKLISVMVLVVAIPLFVAVLVSYITSTNKALADAQASMEWQARYVEGKFALEIEKNLTLIQSLAGNPTIINFVNGAADIPYDAVQGTLAAADAVMGDGENTSVVNTRGMQIARGTGNFVDVSERDYFQAAISGQTYVSNINVSKTTGRRMITVSAPIKDGDKIIGIIHRNYDMKLFQDMLAAEADHAFLITADGHVAAHSEYEISADAEEDRSGAEFYTSGKNQGFYHGDIGNGEEEYLAYVKEPISNFIVCTVADDGAVMAAARQSAIIVIAVGVVLLAAAVVISILMARSFINPVNAVGESLTALADGRFVKVEGFDERADEFGSISRATNSVIEKLDDIVANIKKSAANVGSSSEDLSDMANQISNTADDVSNAVQEIASGATQQANEIQEANVNAGKIGDAVNDVKDSSEKLTVLAEKMRNTSEVSGKSLASLQETSTHMTGKIDDITETIQATLEAVNNIGEKVEGITTIASQTNLLSLNATIEAARAGDAGRGFAVVAEEISKLADDSKTLADEIKTEMERLLTQTKAAVEAAGDVKSGNDEQQVALGETLEAVNGMLEDIRSTVEGVELIASGAETCETSKNAVIDTMGALSAISEENAASSEETGASMEELSATVTTLAGAAGALKEIAEKLNEDMQFFKA